MYLTQRAKFRVPRISYCIQPPPQKKSDPFLSINPHPTSKPSDFQNLARLKDWDGLKDHFPDPEPQQLDMTHDNDVTASCHPFLNHLACCRTCSAMVGRAISKPPHLLVVSRSWRPPRMLHTKAVPTMSQPCPCLSQCDF